MLIRSLHKLLRVSQATLGGPSFLRRLASMAFYEGAVTAGCLLLWRWNKGTFEGDYPEAPFVLVANHAGHYDWMVLDILFGQRGRLARFVANTRFRDKLFSRLLIDHGGVILVDYDRPRRAVVTMLRHLRGLPPGDTSILAVFPEGTRSRDGCMNPPSRGAAWVARKAGMPVVPVALCGTWELWPPSKSLPTLRRVGLSIHVLEPLHPEDFTDDQELIDTAMGRVYERVYADRETR